MPSPAAPTHCPTPRELDDLELLSIGALSPLSGFDAPGSPITLQLPPDLADADTVELVDPEGLPLARVSRSPGVEGWQVAPLARAEHGPFRRLYLTPDQVREHYAGRTFVPVVDALSVTQLDHLRGLGPVVLVALVGTGTPALSAVGLLRATLVAARSLGAEVVAVPLASHGDPQVDHELGVQVLATYAGDDPVVGLPDDTADPGQLEGQLDGDIADIVDAERPEPADQGLVVFFTGLSGSGKSTLARALMDLVLEQGLRSVTSLDGDVVRRNLSAGLTFSKADRETNIRRIGWVAAEISRHRGLAVVSPIAPFDETRQQVRAMVDDAGGAFFLVHVATPLEECERRDRKGLYAKARRGEIPAFTGISSPYEVPDDADVVVDTTGRTIDEALADVVAALRGAGYLDLPDPGAPESAAPAAATPAADGEPLKVLFVCTANICRSPYMELAARELAGPGAEVEFTSAGTHGFRQHAMDKTMGAALGARVDVAGSGFVSRRLTAQLLDEADVVLTAEGSHRTFILDDHSAVFRKVFTLGQFAEATRNVDADLSGHALLEAVGARRGTAEARLDVPDPYGRGPQAAKKCAEQIDDLLRVVVPALTGAGRISG